MAHVAERHDTVIECFGAFRVKEAYSAEETPATQHKTKVTMTFNALGVSKSEGGAGTLDEGLAIAQMFKVKGAEKEWEQRRRQSWRERWRSSCGTCRMLSGSD